MQSKKKIKARKPGSISKKPARRTAKNRTASKPPLTYQRKIEQEFIGEHPEAFEPYVGQWVAMEGTKILAHGNDAVKVTDQARTRGTSPYLFRVLPAKNPNEGYLF